MSEVMEKPAKAEKAEKKPLKQYKIMFSGKGGDIEIGHNFKLNLYKRNVWTTIDENYLNVLRNAVVETIVEDAAGKRTSVRIPASQ
jgi:hypothetical protein